MTLDPTFSALTPSTQDYTDVNQWYFSESIPGVPDTIAPYLAAHGFKISGGTPYEIDGEFAGFLVNMYRNAFSRADAMEGILYAMTFAYNEGRTLNNTRYNDIILGLRQTLTYQQDQAAAIQTDFDTTYALFVANIDAITTDAPTLSDWTASIDALDDAVDTFDAEIATLRASYALNAGPIVTAIATALTEADTALTAYRAQVTLLKAAQSTIQGSIQTILTTETSDLATYVTAINAALDALDDEYDTFFALIESVLNNMGTAITSYAAACATIIAAMEAAQTAHATAIAALLTEITTAVDGTSTTLTDLLALLVTDYTTHVTTATAFLTGLGTTELARINEEYAASLTTQTQQLVNRGFYSSALLTDITTRNTREKSERIGKLNDDLNREKFENQHRLYGQQQAMRGAHISVHQGLGNLEQQAIQFRSQTTMALNQQSQEIRKMSLQSRGEVEQIRMEWTKMQVAVYSDFNKIFIQIKMAAVEGLGEVQKARLAVSRGQAGDWQAIFGQLSDAYGKAMVGEQQFAGIDANLRDGQQKILVSIEELGQAWVRVSGGMLETGINVRATSAKLNAEVRQAYYDIVLRQKAQQAQLRLAGASALAELVTRHVNETTGVAAALFKFAEAREDDFPGIGDMAAVVASLGDNQ